MVEIELKETQGFLTDGFSFIQIRPRAAIEILDHPRRPHGLIERVPDPTGQLGSALQGYYSEGQTSMTRRGSKRKFSRLSSATFDAVFMPRQ